MAVNQRPISHHTSISKVGTHQADSRVGAMGVATADKADKQQKSNK